MIRTFSEKSKKTMPEVKAGDVVCVEMETRPGLSYEAVVAGAIRYRINPEVHADRVLFSVPALALLDRQTVVVSVHDQHGEKYFCKRFAVVNPAADEEVSDEQN